MAADKILMAGKIQKFKKITLKQNLNLGDIQNNYIKHQSFSFCPNFQAKCTFKQ